MFSRIQARPVAFTGAIHAFGDQTSPQNLVGATDLSSKDEFRRDLSKAVQNMTQPPNIELPDSPQSRKPKPAPAQGAAMSYTGGWANPMNPVMGGAPIPHSDPGLETPSFQNRTLPPHQFEVPPNQAHQTFFRGFDQQAKPTFMATVADFPSVMHPKRVDLPHVDFERQKTGAKAKLRAFKNHHPSDSPFSMNLPYMPYESV